MPFFLGDFNCRFPQIISKQLNFIRNEQEPAKLALAFAKSGYVIFHKLPIGGWQMHFI
jgi:hypothetical protein